MNAFFRHCAIWLLPALLGAASVAHGQEHGQVLGPRLLLPRFEGFETFDVFFTLNRHLGCEPITNLEDFFNSPPENTLVVLLGDLGRENRLDRLTSGQLSEFWHRGGAVLVASGDKDNGLLKFCKVSIDGMVVRQGGSDVVKKIEANFPGPYGGFPEWPLLKTSPFLPFETMLGPERWDDVALVANGPSVLVPQPDTPLEEIVEFPNNCWTEDPRDEKIPYAVEIRRAPPTSKPGAKLLNLARLDHAVYAMGAPARVRGNGPILVLAGERLLGDRALFNEDNFDFALLCRDFLLKDGRDRPRQRMLFIVDGDIVPSSYLVPEDFEPKLPPMPPLPPITTKMIDTVLADVERQEILRKSLMDLMPPQTGLRLLLGAGSLALVLYLLYRLGKGRLRIDTKAPLVVDPEPTDAARRRAALAERGDALATLGNFAEPAQALARQWFWQNADVSPVQWDEPGFRFPGFSVAGTWWQRWTLGRELEWLRGMAQNCGHSLSGRAFQKLHVRLKELANLVDTRVIAIGNKT